MAKKIVMTAEQFAEKQARRLKNSVQDITAGVNAVTEAPTKKAAERADKMLTNLTASVQSGKWARNTSRVTLEEWREKMLNKGVGRIAAGIDGARAKVVDFADQLLKHEAALQAKVQAMPDLTLEDSISRMVAWTQGMSKFQRK